MLVQNLIALIETTAPPRLAASWDKSGVQVASAAEDIRVMCVGCWVSQQAHVNF